MSDKPTGEVTRVSKYGIQLNGIDHWYNWAHGYIDQPIIEKGDTVTFDVNERGYIIRLDLDSPPPEATGGSRDSTFRAPRHIIRQGALGAAIEFCGHESPTTVPEYVLKVAQQFEEWILRE